MKSEDFIGLLGDIDSKMIEKASEDLFNWQRSQEGEIVVAGSPRKASLWLSIASVACAAAAVVGGFFLIKNIRQNGSFGIVSDPESSSVQSGDSGSNSVSSGGSSDSVPVIDNDPTKLSYNDMEFEAVDPFNNLITYSWAVEPDRISYELLNPSQVSCLVFDDWDTSHRYMYEFFGNANTLVYGGHSPWQRCVLDGHFECEPTGERVYAPVGGRVITVAEDQEGFGNAVAVEIPGQKIFVMYHLDEVLVKAGDVVVEGQELGSCGTTGAVEAGNSKLTLVLMKKKTDPPVQDLSKEFDGLTLGISTNKCVYEFGEPIHLTATLENNTGKDLYLYSGGSNSLNLMPSISNLIEYPRRMDIGYGDTGAPYVVFQQGEKIVQDFTFQTYTGYLQEFAEVTGYDGVVLRSYPDPNRPAESGTYFGYFAVTATDDKSLNVAEEGETYTLNFAIDIKGNI